MKITILAVGKEKDFSGHELVNEYIDRISHYYPVEILYLSGSDKKSEHEKLEKTLEKFVHGGSDFVIALDETGKKVSSVGLSDLIGKAANMSSKNIVFIIGGAYGIPANIRESANLTLSLSDMTFTHQMVRLLIAEQIYRACTIQKGEGYHHQ